MTIAGYESMSLVGAVAESLSPRREPGIESSRLEPTSRFGITRISEAEYLVDTAANWPLDEYCGAPSIAPSFKSGKCDGLKFLTVRPDSPYAELGFQRGDVVRSINGFGLCSPELTLTAYHARYLDVEFERRGAILRRRYWLR